MQKSGSNQKFLRILTLIFASIFVVIGVGILTGLLFPERNFLSGGMRIIFGSILTGYGLIRGGMVLRKMRSLKRGEDTKKT